jgi:hypothetical protein
MVRDKEVGSASLSLAFCRDHNGSRLSFALARYITHVDRSAHTPLSDFTIF